MIIWSWLRNLISSSSKDDSFDDSECVRTVGIGYCYDCELIDSPPLDLIYDHPMLSLEEFLEKYADSANFSHAYFCVRGSDYVAFCFSWAGAPSSICISLGRMTESLWRRWRWSDGVLEDGMAFCYEGVEL